MRQIITMISLVCALALMADVPVRYAGSNLQEEQVKNLRYSSDAVRSAMVNLSPSMKSMPVSDLQPEPGSGTEVTVRLDYDETLVKPEVLVIARTDTSEPEVEKVELCYEDYDNWTYDENDPSTWEPPVVYLHEVTRTLEPGQYLFAPLFFNEKEEPVFPTKSIELDSSDIVLDFSLEDATEVLQFHPVTHEGMDFNTALVNSTCESSIYYVNHLTVSIDGKKELLSFATPFINPDMILSPDSPLKIYFSCLFACDKGKDFLSMGPLTVDNTNGINNADDYVGLRSNAVNTIFRPNEESYRVDAKYFSCFGYKFGMMHPDFFLPSNTVILGSDQEYIGYNEYYLANLSKDNVLEILAIDDLPEYGFSMFDAPLGFSCNLFGTVPPFYSEINGKIYGAWRPLGQIGVDYACGMNMPFAGIEKGSYVLPEPNMNFAMPFERDKEILFGNNTPIVQFTTLSSSSFKFNFIGRLQESMNADLMASDIRMTLSGEDISAMFGETGCPDIEGMISTVSKNPGPLEIDLRCSNRLIDGKVPATTAMTMNWDASAGKTPPALQMLQFRDLEDNVTDRFVSKNDAVMNFAAGCFYFNEEVIAYDCERPLEVIAEVAPRGTENFSELTVIEMPEKFYMPGYGAFYTASLESIVDDSPDGWYDVRITLHGENGTQVQTLSPAFHIGDSNSVMDIAADSVRVEGSDIIALEGSRIYDMDGRERMARGLERGIYLVRTGAGTCKVVVR